MTQEGKDPLAFMTKSGTFKQNIEYLVQKPFQKEIDVTPYNLPRELAGLREKVEEAEQLQKLSDFKSQVIYTLV